jgi:hypothetical protein
MANSYGPKGIVTDGLVFSADAGNTQCWNPNASTSGSFNDLIGNNTGTVVNDTSGSLGSKGSWVFDGTDDYVDCGSSVGVLDTGDAFSLSFWFYLTDDDPLTIHRAIMGRSSTTVGWVARIHDAISGVPRLSFALTNGGSNYKAQATSEVSHNTWYYGACTYDGTDPVGTANINVYLNGVLNNASTDSGGTVNNFTYATNTKIGSIDGAWYFQGNLGPCMIYNKELSITEIQQNYNSQKARFGL